MSHTVVVALGGNAILQPKQKGTAEEQRANVAVTARSIVEMIKEGYRVVVTHGNGPQVGNILIQNAEAGATVPAMPLDICGAESQGLIGYLIQQSLYNILRSEGIDRPVATILTQVVVSREDPAFANPTKPVGPFYTEVKARKFMVEKGEKWIEDAGRGWRKVVPSPKPREIVEAPVIRELVDAGYIVIASGGGGIPVVREADGTLKGVEAVIDKDLAGAVLAREVEAGTLMILTDVERVAINYGKPDQRFLERVTIEEARAYMAEGHFKEGSMKPKVQAAINFAEIGGRSIISSLNKAREALAGTAGTHVVAPQPESSASGGLSCISSRRPRGSLEGAARCSTSARVPTAGSSCS